MTLLKPNLFIDLSNMLHRVYSRSLGPEEMTIKDLITDWKELVTFLEVAFKPKRMVWACDSPYPYQRHLIDENYKGHREEKTEVFLEFKQEVMKLMKTEGRETIMKYGYEADDILASLAHRYGNCFILSADTDLLQLLELPGVVQLRPRKGIEFEWAQGPEAAQLYFGVTPDKIKHLKALIGDRADNIPTVARGIGDVTGAKLINHYGDIYELYLHLLDQDFLIPKFADKLLEGRERAFKNLQLATLVTDLEIK